MAEFRQRVGVLVRQLATLGGGELHALELSRALTGCAQVEIIHPGDVSAMDMVARWNRPVDPVILRGVPGLSDALVHEISREYDWLINCSDWLPPLASARSAIMVYFPFKVNLTLAGVLRREVGYGLRPLKRWLSAHYRHLLTSLPTRAEVAAVRHYDVVFAISNYTARWVRRFWRRDCQVCTPLVTPVPPQQVRQHSIVHIGRFFNDFGYNKRQHVLIQAFRRMIDRGLQGWHLHLMGGLGTRPSHREYFQELELAARGSPITLHPNAPRNAIEARLSSASIYWHASGHGANLARNPMDVEHFGISVVEAMSAGCVPMVFNAGGPPEIVGEDAGLVWNTLDELEHGTLRLIGDATAMARLRAAAMQRSSLFTDRDAFFGSVRAPLGFA